MSNHSTKRRARIFQFLENLTFYTFMTLAMANMVVNEITPVVWLESLLALPLIWVVWGFLSWLQEKLKG